MISFIKNLFSKKTKIQDKSNSDSKSFALRIKEIDLSNADKIERLIKNQSLDSIEDENISDDNNLYHDFNFDTLDLTELMYAIETVFDIEMQEGAFPLTFGGIKDYVDMKIDNPDYIVPEEDLIDEGPSWGLAGLLLTLYNERLYGRSLAIRELVDNNYQILPDESGNPFKELINYTIKYFERYFADRPTEAEINLKASFPIMHHYLYRQIFKQQYSVPKDILFDEQKGYDEFLTFCSNEFTSKYPDKTKRDNAIKQEFKILGTDLIHYIEEERAK